MILLTTNTDEIQVITGSAVSSIEVQASYVDLPTSTQVQDPGQTNTVITTATTTTVIGSPAVGSDRALKELSIYNSSGSQCEITIIHTDGVTSATLYNTTLSSKKSLHYTAAQGFYKSTGGEGLDNDTIWSAKGDLVAGTGIYTASTIGVGADGEYLIADSAETTGLKWSTLPPITSDPLFSAKGDLIVGTGPSSSTFLSVAGAQDGWSLITDANTPEGVKWADAAGAGTKQGELAAELQAALTFDGITYTATDKGVAGNLITITINANQAGVTAPSGIEFSIVNDDVTINVLDATIGTYTRGEILSVYTNEAPQAVKDKILVSIEAGTSATSLTSTLVTTSLTGGTPPLIYSIRATKDYDPDDTPLVVPDFRGEFSIDLQTQRLTSDQIASGTASVILGGYGNRSQGQQSIVVGGDQNDITFRTGEDYLINSVITGGLQNQIQNTADIVLSESVIVGGHLNYMNSSRSAIVGGTSNSVNATGIQNTIVGGNSNYVSGTAGNSVIVGGQNNGCQSASLATIISGNLNSINGSSDRSAIAAGYSNLIQSSGVGHFIGAGNDNTITGQSNSMIGAGHINIISHQRSFIGAGYNNSIAQQDAAIAAGYQNVINSGAQRAYIGSGQSNNVQALSGYIGGGVSNLIQNGSDYAVIVAGNDNTISGSNGDQSFIGSGYQNNISQAHSVICGGYQNNLSQQYTSITGGRQNIINSGATYGAITGGYLNLVSAIYGTIVGGYDSEIQNGSNNATICGGNVNIIAGTNGDQSVIGGGYSNYISQSNSVIVGGYDSTISQAYATIGGGYQNNLSQQYASTTGGRQNIINSGGAYGAITGGYLNLVSGQYSTIVGGYDSEIQNGSNSAVIGGGNFNTIAGANGDNSTICGGYSNYISQSNSVIGGGNDNTITQTYATIGGGFQNNISGQYVSIGGGYRNILSQSYASTTGGRENTINSSGSYGAITGGYLNLVSGQYGTIAGGYDGEIQSGSNHAVICGGNVNIIAGGNGDQSVIGGGYSNYISEANSVIVGGYDSTVTSQYSVISGGYQNNSSQPYASTTGGRQNIINVGGSYGAIGGGHLNLVSAQYGTIVGGYDHEIQNGSNNATICGGNTNQILGADSDNSTIGGGYLNTINTGTGGVATIIGGQGNNATGIYSTIGGGFSHTASEQYSTVVGGYQNTAAGIASTVAGGYNNTANGELSSIIGGLDAVANSYGQTARANGSFTNPGDAQKGTYILRGITTTDYEMALYLDGVVRSSLTHDGITYVSNQTSIVGNGITITILENEGVNGVTGVEFSIANGLDITIKTQLGITSYTQASIYNAYLLSAQEIRDLISLNVTDLNLALNTALTTTNLSGALGANEYLAIPQDSTWFFTIQVAARRTDGGAQESALYKFEGGIENNGGIISLIGVTAKTTFAEPNLNWDVTLEPLDNSPIDEALILRVTGEANKTIRWVATVETTEVMS